jgi:hypothetical protein
MRRARVAIARIALARAQRATGRFLARLPRLCPCIRRRARARRAPPRASRARTRTTIATANATATTAARCARRGDAREHGARHTVPPPPPRRWNTAHTDADDRRRASTSAERRATPDGHSRHRFIDARDDAIDGTRARAP